MFQKTWCSNAVAGLAFICISGAATAAPTATVNGVTFPIGIISGGNTLESGILDETLITQPGAGQTFQGVGRVDSINDSSSNQVWGNGQNGVELAFVFSGYTTTARSTFPNLYFTGGQIAFYTLAAGATINGLGSVAADITAVQSGQLWITENGAPSDPQGDTLTTSILTGSSLTNFGAAHGDGVLDVAGGPAAPYFATHTFANVFDPTNGGFSDQTFTSDFSSGASGEFAVSGSGTIKANAATPEPGSLAVIGVALAGIGVVRRRWR